MTCGREYCTHEARGEFWLISEIGKLHSIQNVVFGNQWACNHFDVKVDSMQERGDLENETCQGAAFTRSLKVTCIFLVPVVRGYLGEY